MSYAGLSAPQVLPFPVGSAAVLRGQMAQSVTPSPRNVANPRAATTDAAAAAQAASQHIEQMSHEFEALLLAFMFKAMRQTVRQSDLFGKAQHREWYTDLFDLELARSFTRGRSIGLSAYLQAGLHQLQGQRQPLPRAILDPRRQESEVGSSLPGEHRA
jgi:Rod binding domain-containing protein